MTLYFPKAETQNKKLNDWVDALAETTLGSFDSEKNGNLPKWMKAFDNLPDVTPSVVELDTPVIQVGLSNDIEQEQRKTLEEQLKVFHPWRKGPFNLFGIDIDTEWRSDWKWARLEKEITSLRHKNVLDIGCGSGYHCLRMAGEGAGFTVGIDTTLGYVMQFQALQKYIQNPAVSVLPLSDAQMPERFDVFDTVFSMGVLYHQKSPFDHLQRIYSLLAEGGEAIMETLVIDGPAGQVLVPKDRYAQMRNVWFLPSCLTLEQWLERAGFKNIRLIDVNQTSAEEQRSTPWMTFQSLKDFLDPDDTNKTIEGYPAPKRAIFITGK